MICVKKTNIVLSVSKAPTMFSDNIGAVVAVIV